MPESEAKKLVAEDAENKAMIQTRPVPVTKGKTFDWFPER